MSAAMYALQTDATANGNGVPASVLGFDAAQQVEIVETAGGTATVTFEGSFGGAAADTWYAVGYQRIDATAAPSRSVTGVSVGANSAHVYQILDSYAQIRARISSIAGSAHVTVRLLAVP